MCYISVRRLLGYWLWLSPSVASAAYAPLREYAGSNFFDGWDYYGFHDNTTWGNVTYVDRQTAMSSRLTYVNGAGNAVVKVDNTSFIQNGPLVYRNSVRITSQEVYGIGSLIIIDVRHIPYGCSVWPAFWTLGSGKTWPQGGEIDIIESINLLPNNQIALHTTPGCFQSQNLGQTGQTTEGDCSTPQGCVVRETKANSYESGFAQAGGGVWATQIDASGIFIWFWSRPDVPENIKTSNNASSIDTVPWGIPTASYPADGCNISQYFTPQNLILLTTLCGNWAGVPGIYDSTCHTPTMSCAVDNVVGPGSPTYDQAYWEISWIRTYTLALPGQPTTITSSDPPVQDASSMTVSRGATTSTTQATSAALTPGPTVSSAVSSTLPTTSCVFGSVLLVAMLGNLMLR
ncbi:hypothetical protein AGABI1DRAFT_38657 [Agaricus bisporus var. burnettii JB137-S8]|uniref:GH16 domain-containing protein n=1 Tax=Agaricus bisporus var. burnettii (strain JB137-S8 / ATCC MYA-4627 / FGSC 10392) TaxID=597362 RepID=K5X9A7_AGABU|nr:uncharacterized protein AGABI1DRAFT_38657 [Agaricus bisporus var. burnettii JB137-S8]EKM79808.1 hypothetical protein AGABI1DRAFT_38657 [Agaricus bisporus var. burnettii JB137-S8]